LFVVPLFYTIAARPLQGEYTMRLRIIINDKECTSPIVKFGLAAAALIGTIAIAVLILFVLLPIIGVSVTVVLGVFIAISVGVFAAAVALTVGGAVLASLIGLVDYLANKFGRR
jgi:hypothetical protein